MAGSAAAEGPPLRVSVSAMISDPGSYFDKQLSIVGVVRVGAWGPNLCELPSAAEKGQSCIDMDEINLPFTHIDWAYHGAVAEVIGYFAHQCSKEGHTSPDGERVEIVCVDRGGNGFIYAQSLRFVGAIEKECRDECESDGRVTEIALPDGEGQALQQFAARVVAAGRSRRVDEWAALVLPSQRSQAEYHLSLPKQRAKILPAAFAKAPASAASPGEGFRLFRFEYSSYPTEEKLCFCTTDDCRAAWPDVGRKATAFRRSPIHCVYVWRSPNGWVLLY